ncbi:FtsX-like permease family protein [Streptococcus agalactiae]|uniref:FtsX-like permease family protein n=1 Tax=Streptococcus agalactiae TaxID=1311 RepID=UPI00214D6A92|nr:FtsX-like permease family protein [Streptococcus agalactiae]
MTRRIVAYVGSILCVSFLIGIASIIYSKLYSLVEEESKKYSIMMKIGLSKKELKEILASTLKWIFIVPFLIALILSWIFVLLMNQVTMTSYIELTAICSSIYILVEFILYIAIKRKYERKILGSIYEM